MENRNSWYRKLPKVDILLDSVFSDAVTQYGKTVVMECVKEEITHIRAQVPDMHSEAELEQELALMNQRIEMRLIGREKRHFQQVMNATGVILHTNLGRAPLPKEAVVRATQKLTRYTNLEYDLNQGSRVLIDLSRYWRKYLRSIRMSIWQRRRFLYCRCYLPVGKSWKKRQSEC